MTTNNDVKQYVEPRNISLYPDDWQAVARVANSTGVRSFSAALRLIIREFERMQQNQEATHDNLVIVN